jgi:hypothetical protein
VRHQALSRPDCNPLLRIASALATQEGADDLVSGHALGAELSIFYTESGPRPASDSATRRCFKSSQSGCGDWCASRRTKTDLVGAPMVRFAGQQVLSYVDRIVGAWYLRRPWSGPCRIVWLTSATR